MGCPTAAPKTVKREETVPYFPTHLHPRKKSAQAAHEDRKEKTREKQTRNRQGKNTPSQKREDSKVFCIVALIDTHVIVSSEVKG